MNIIAGTARGRRLKTLPGAATRPTQGKVRAALFNILMAWTPEARWLDLFAGSGAIGLEAASRGAAQVVLVEKAPAALAVIRENVALTKLAAEVLPLDAEKALRRLAGQAFDVVFLDPPYALDPMPVVQAVDELGLLSADGRLVVEHRAERAMPDAIGRLIRRDTRTYADTALSFYARGELAATPGAAGSGASAGAEAAPGSG